MKQFILCIALGISLAPLLTAQSSSPASEDDLPYVQIPDYPEDYTAATVAARMVDGLGYRYFWATKGLRPQDLEYQPSDDSRQMQETLAHLYGLSKTIVNAISQEPNIRSANREDMSFNEQRAATLHNFKSASDLLKAGQDEDVVGYDIIFKRGEQESRFPFWNLLNGPLADALYHTGQIVAFRRAAGNPIHPGVNVFRGVTRPD